MCRWDMSSTRSALGLVLGAFGLVALGCSGAGQGAPADAGNPPAAVTYHQDVAPILEAKCISCHYVGGIAPFALDTPEAARPVAGLIKGATATRVMPPWPPGPLSPKILHDRPRTTSSR